MRISLRLKVLAVLAVLMLVVGAAPGIATDLEEEPVEYADGHPPEDPEDGFFSHDHEDELNSVGSGLISPFFNESAGCFEPDGVGTPYSTTNSSANRSLPSNHQVRGPWGDFFGRDYGDVSGSMVSWTVPMSGGAVRSVHVRALPAFQQVTANLAAEQAKGNYYEARHIGTFVWRRIGGSYRMSTHSFGATIDINSDTNPYSGDNRLITDMPQWYVSAWRDAGFCWGGDWQTIKDPMHFSWKGPKATPGYDDVPGPFPPSTSAGDYTQVGFSGKTAFGSLDPELSYGFLDGNRDGAPDLYRVKPYGAQDLLIEYARSSRDFLQCGVSQAVVPDGAAVDGEVLVADYDGDAHPDVWVIDTSRNPIRIRVHPYATEYLEVETLATGVVPGEVMSFGAADYNRDGLPDLYVVHHKNQTRLEVWSGAGGFTTKLVDVTTQMSGTADAAKWRFSLADHDADGIPDLVVIRVDGVVALHVIDGAGGYDDAPLNLSTGATAAQEGHYDMGDYDGDGRPDLLSILPAGTLRAHLGGNQGGSETFWFQPADWTCEASGSFVPWDFDGDRYSDLAIGVPFEDIGAGTDGGAVNVLYAGSEGLSAAGDQLWHQDVSGIESSSEDGDVFGEALAAGDFDGDGFADLAVGTPGDSIGSPIPKGGLVNVIYGTVSGLSATNDQMWHQDVGSIIGGAGSNDLFGSALAVGDFDGDGFDDLAVGVPGDRAGGHAGAGVVNVIYGTEDGLDDAGNQIWHQDVDGVTGIAGGGDGFGSTLAAGDFDEDGFFDLAIGAPGDKVDGEVGAGVVHVLYGTAQGLSATGDDWWSQTTKGVKGQPNRNDGFGAAIAAGDLDGDGAADLAIGVPGEERGGDNNAGQVHVLLGGDDGVTTDGARIWHQDLTWVKGIAQAGDHFGAALAIADHDGDGFNDLSIGVPDETLNGRKKAGGVIVLYGRVGGVSAAGSDFWKAGYDGLAGASGDYDHFGTTLRGLDFDGDSFADLVAGVPGEDLAAINVGAIHVIYGSEAGLSAARNEIWHQDKSGVADDAEAGDGLGELR